MLPKSEKQIPPSRKGVSKWDAVRQLCSQQKRKDGVEPKTRQKKSAARSANDSHVEGESGSGNSELRRLLVALNAIGIFVPCVSSQTDSEIMDAEISSILEAWENRGSPDMLGTEEIFDALRARLDSRETVM